ncbi:MAG: tetratricopeptide repeat protein [Gammaproteobacteria bacterium]|nr:tetratricopeptide repeat protein [Gammaproteobacteria bacterium]
MNSSALPQSLRIFLVSLIGILLYFIYIAANHGIADVKVYNSRAIMDSWASGKRVVEKNDWESAHQSLLSALEYSPENPEYLALLGNLYEWRVANQPVNSPSVITDLNTALDFYRLALLKRPAFAFYWANIAVIKSMLAEVDKEFYLAVDRALVLGAWEPGVQLKIADATLGVWYLLDENGWNKMIENIDRGLQVNAKPILAMARKNKVLYQLCGKLKRTDAMLLYCK